MRSRQATSTLTCPARMSFTVINRVCHGAPPQPPGRRVPPCLPTPGDVTQPAQPPSSTVRGRASLDGEVGVFPETEGVHLQTGRFGVCLLYTSDAADEEDSVDLGGRRIIKKK